MKNIYYCYICLKIYISGWWYILLITIHYDSKYAFSHHLITIWMKIIYNNIDILDDYQLNKYLKSILIIMVLYIESI
jgi:hypothetical protein